MVDRDATSVERLRAELGRDFLVSFFRWPMTSLHLSRPPWQSPSGPRGSGSKGGFPQNSSAWLGSLAGWERRPLLRATAGAVRVSMTQEPFEFRIPGVSAEDSIEITAHLEDAIFKVKSRRRLNATTIPFFAGGTGMADTNFGSGELFLCDDGHMYLDLSSRLARKMEAAGPPCCSTPSTWWPKARAKQSACRETATSTPSCISPGLPPQRPGPTTGTLDSLVLSHVSSA